MISQPTVRYFCFSDSYIYNYAIKNIITSFHTDICLSIVLRIFMRIMKNRLYIYSNDVSLTKTYYLYLCSVKVAMEYVITFLQSSTIHGLPFIATTSRHVRFFWILVVTFGFIMSGYIIHQSFEAWNESPIKIIIKSITLLISSKTT